MATKPKAANKPKASDRRWLSREAPQLPQPDCSRPDTCRCIYQHHEDRRSGDGRRAEERDAFVRPGQVVQERRSRKDRRASGDGRRATGDDQ